MSVVLFRTFLLNVKDGFQSVLIYVRSNAERLESFNASPWGMTLKSIFSITLLALVILQAYNLIHGKQFSLDKILPLLGSLSSALLNNASTFGKFITMALQVGFVAGPWLLLASMVTGICQQTCMFLFNSYHALKAESGSVERKHHLQAAIYNVFSALLITSMMMTVIYGLLFPGTAPVVLTTFIVIAISMLVAQFLWRNISHTSRLDIKQILGFGKPPKEIPDFTNPPKFTINSNYEKQALPVAQVEMKQPKFFLGFWPPSLAEEEGIELQDFSENNSHYSDKSLINYYENH